MLTAEWLQRRPNVAWYRSSAASADLAAFAAGVAAACGRIVPDASDRLGEHLRSTGATEYDPAALADLLAGDLASWSANGLLVIDDYHVVQQSRPVEEFVERLLAVSPIRLLVTTRVRPAWASARRMLYGEIAEIGADLLAMTDDEANQVLRDLPPRSVRRAVLRARGWPAVLGLAALTSATDVPDVTVSDALYGYFAEEVLRRETPEVQRFMLLASVPATIDATLARELLGFADADDVLERLAAEGLLEASDGGFRFHLLVREFLRRKLESEAPEQARELATRAVTALVERGRVEDAVELALESGDVERAAEIAAGAASGLLIAGRIETLERWLEACGTAALDQPPLLLARAAIHTRRGELTDAVSLAGAVAERTAPEESHASRAWYLKAQALHQLGERREALACADCARELARTREDRTNALVLCTMAAGALELDDANYLAELDQLTEADPQARFRWASAEIWSALQRPTLAGVWPRLAPLVALVDSCDGPMLKNDVLVAASQLNVLRGEYAVATDLAGRAVSVCADFRLRLNHVYAVLALANAQIGRSQYRRAERTLRSVAESRYADRPGVKITLEIARLKLALGRRRSVHASSLDQGVAERTSRRSRGLHAALCALAAAAAGDRERCRAAVAEACEVSHGAEARFYSRYAELLSDLDESRVRTARLVALLEETVAADVLDTFVTAYRADPRLLAAASADPRGAAIARRAAAAAGDRALAEEAGLFETRRRPGTADLTPRELEVLELLADGLSNAEIARRLYITPSTAKVHVHHILEKLGSKSRFEAVMKTRARE